MKQLWRSLRGWVILVAILGGGYAVLHLVVLVPKPIEVRVHEVDNGVVERTVSNTKAGSVRARLTSELSSDSSGSIVEICRREGDPVKKGEQLLKIDDRTAKASLAVTEKELESAEADKAQAEANKKDAEREHKRKKSLFDEGRIPEQELDAAATQVDVTKAALASAEARVKQQEARVEQSKLEVNKLTLRAPFDGVVTDLYVEVGEWAVPGKALVRLLDPTNLYVRAELDEVDIGQVKMDLPVRMELDPYRGKTFEGNITKIFPFVSEALEQNRTIAIEVEFKDRSALGDLKPGTSADVEVILEETDGDSLRIPTLALMEGNRVLVMKDGLAVEVTIGIGLKNWDYTEVTSGLKKGDKVITSLDREEVKAGAKVVLEEEDKK